MLGRLRADLRQRSLAAARGASLVQSALGRDGASVALTFDDGPDAEATSDVLDILRQHNALATFFLVGKKAQAHPELVRRIVADGHSVGSHSGSHSDMWTLSAREVFEEYRHGRDALSNILGRRVSLVRPPKGWIDMSGAMAMRTLRLRPWLWTINGEDWVDGYTAAHVVAAVGKPVAGDVILLHDGLEKPLSPSTVDRRPMLDALNQIIPSCQQRGLHFAALPESGTTGTRR